MNTAILNKSLATFALSILSAMALYSQPTEATTAFGQINLVSDDASANPAQIVDPNLVNAWGISYAPTGPFWVSDNGTGLSTVYRVDPTTQVTTKIPLIVSIPGNGSVTGQVFNAGSAFNSNRFIFVSEDGTISGWRGALGTTAEVLSAPSNAIYKGVATASVGGNSYVYAANFSSGNIDVVKDNASVPNLSSQFVDPNLPSGYAPFNIQNLNDKLYVTYAQQDPNSSDELAGIGKGLVNVFDTQGNFLQRIVSANKELNAPWGLAIAPASFGEFSGDLLVGNFGDGTINAYNLTTHKFDGQLSGTNGKALAIDGLWALTIGNGGSAGNTQSIYFSAGPNGEAHGLFGAITVVPVPAAVWLLSSALLGLSVLRRRAFH